MVKPETLRVGRGAKYSVAPLLADSRRRGVRAAGRRTEHSSDGG